MKAPQYLLRLICCLLATTLVGLPMAIAQPAAPLKMSTPKLPVVDQPDPAKSFWRDQVHYPFPVKYAQASGRRGVAWEIAYMDEYAGPARQKAQARTLVLIHGRGTNAGTWGQLMQTALAHGMRVVALDIPHYGKSIPGNLDKPLARSLNDVRDAFYQLIVVRLKITKATYLGHSLGGQLVFGYALQHPDHVERIIAVAPGGLEEFTSTGLFNRAFEYDLDEWSRVWQGTGALAREFARRPETIELDYYFQGDGSSPGYFVKDGAYPRFITDIRTRMIAGNEREYRNYVTSYVREMYAVAIEVQATDPNNLNRRLEQLKMPVLLALGEKDPFFPVKVLSGNSDVRLDLVKPFYERLAHKGNAPQIKIYPETGHFPFIDAPEQFAADVLAFMNGKTLAGLENIGTYETTVLRRLGVQKKLTNFWNELVLDCVSRT